MRLIRIAALLAFAYYLDATYAGHFIGVFGGTSPALPLLAVIAGMLGVGLLMSFCGAFLTGFWTFVLGGLGVFLVYGATLPGLAGLNLPLHPSAHMLLAVFFAGLYAYAWLAGFKPSFRSGGIEVRDGGDHLAVKSGDDVTVFPAGLALCTAHYDTTTKTVYGGGTQVVPNIGTISTYGPGGYTTGTVTTYSTVSTPFYSYDKRVRTGRTRYSVEEVGVDHGLLTAPKPGNVTLKARHAVDYRGRCTGFLVGAWGGLRFEFWRKHHARLFHCHSTEPARRIKRAAEAHAKEMKQRFGKTAHHHLTLNHALELVGYAGLSKDKLHVFHVAGVTAATLSREQLRDDMLSMQTLRLSRDAPAVELGKVINGKVSEWVQLNAMRG